MGEKIQLAALLHNIGKFWQGTSKQGLHQELSNEFIKTYVPLEEWRPSSEEQQQEVIITADWLSSGENEGREEKRFLLVGGDISGVQKFIYKLASPEKAQKGMSKQLRGRSFMVRER